MSRSFSQLVAETPVASIRNNTRLQVQCSWHLTWIHTNEQSITFQEQTNVNYKYVLALFLVQKKKGVGGRKEVLILASISQTSDSNFVDQHNIGDISFGAALAYIR